MRKPRRDDRASTHVLEAVIIASIMVCSVVYVATFQAPPPAAHATREALQQRSLDALSILSDTPAPGDAMGQTMLSAYVAECLQGNCSHLDAKMRQLLPAGASYSLAISNGYRTFTIQDNRTPPGEAVTVSRLFEPQWSYTFVGNGQSMLTPSRDPMVSYALPVFNSNIIDQGGSPLRILLHGTADGANVTLSASASTQASTPTNTSTPAASLYFVDGSSQPVGVLDVTSQSMVSSAAGDYPSKANLNFRLRVTEAGGVELPAGAELRLDMPRAWNASASAALNPGWTLVASQANASGASLNTSIIARTLAPLKSASLDFLFNATYHGDPVPDYTFHALLGKGAAAEANLLVRGNTSTSSAYARPALAASTPRPMGGSSAVATTWVLGVAVPGSGIVIDDVEIIEQEGRAIFGTASVVAGGGSVHSYGDRIVWTPSGTLQPGLHNLVLSIAPSGTVASPTTQRATYTPPFTVADFTGRYLDQVATGFWRQTVLPNTSAFDGYENVGGAAGTTHTIRSDNTFRGVSMPGSANYTVANLTVNTSAIGSYVGVERRSVPVGGTAIIEIDVQSLLFQLAQAGLNTSVSMHIYPPWSGDNRMPIDTSTSFDSQLLQSDITALTLMDLNGDGYPDPILGTSNGRVLALHGLTGGRLEGDVFNAPIAPSTSGSSAPAITQLTTTIINGTAYVVVGTSQGSVFLLDDGLRLAASWYFSNAVTSLTATVTAMDASTDVDGDGRLDVAIGVEFRNPSTSAVSDALYVLRSLAGSATLAAYNPAGNDPDHFYNPVGTPQALLALSRMGGWSNATTGLATSYTYTPGVTDMQTPALNTVPPSGQGSTIMLPRAGLRGVGADGRDSWLLAGAPVTVARTYDFEGDGVPDILAGQPAGYVILANGSLPTSPLSGLMLSGPTEWVAAVTHDAAHAAALSRDGTPVFTANGWNSYVAMGCVQGLCQLPPGLTGIAMNASTSGWVSGPASLLMRSLPASASDAASDAGLAAATVIPNVTRGGATLPLDPLVPLSTPYDFNDIAFRYGPQRDVGFAIGTRTGCLAPASTCGAESLIIKTTNGGQSWWAATSTNSSLLSKTNGTLTKGLTRMNWTNDSLGWVVGAGGTLLRTTNGGSTWQGLDVNGTSVDLLGIGCVPQAPATCIVVGKGGMAWKSTNALDAWPNFSAMPQVLDALGAGKDALSVGFVNASVAFLGSSNVVLQTWDGGSHWSALPLGYVPGNANVVNTLPDGNGFLYGGNVAQDRIFQFAHYNMSSRAQTTNLAALGGIPAGAKVSRVDVDASDVRAPPNQLVTYNVSTNGGGSWKGVLATGAGATADAHLEYGSAVKDFYTHYYAPIPVSVQGDDVRIRLDFTTYGESTAMSAWASNLKLRFYWNDSGGAHVSTAALDLNETTYKDAAATDADWTAGLGGVHQPLANSAYWVANVSGAVLDVLVGKNVAGDARAEVYVATGDVIAENSPDSILYAGANAGQTTGVDNRVYMLDGKTGAILARTATFAGHVTHLALSDVDNDGVPEMLYATVESGATGILYGLYPSNLTVAWKQDLAGGRPSGLAAGRIQGPAGDAIVVTGQRTTGGIVVPGEALAYRTSGARAWSSLADSQGHYTVSVPVPDWWLFGPYVVEVAVDWRTTGMGFDLQSQSPVPVVQTERFYDYFLVTPPGALSPPSPLYNVQLTTWYDDWR